MRQSWIFQSVPEQFRLADFLNTGPKQVTWRAKQHTSGMKIGDRVFLWQAIGKGHKSQSGVFASGFIASEPEESPDDGPSAAYWMDPNDATQSEMRVLVELDSVKTSPVIDREACRRDRILNSMTILQSAQGSNFKLNDAEAEHLEEMWASRVRRVA